MQEPSLGLLVMFEGDYRQLTIPVLNVTAFTSVAHKLASRSDDVSGTYITTSPSVVGNVITTAIIGDKASIPTGTYRYYLTGTYDGGKVRTWYVDIYVLPKDTSQFHMMHYFDIDYDPVLSEGSMYEGDVFALEAIFPEIADFSSVTGELRLGSDNSVDAVYCSGAAAYTDSKLTSASIGGKASVPAGAYGYFITGVWGNAKQKTTWVWPIICLPKVGAE